MPQALPEPLLKKLIDIEVVRRRSDCGHTRLMHVHMQEHIVYIRMYTQGTRTHLLYNFTLTLLQACIQKEQEVRVNFVQAVVRRIRRLLQQHCPPAPAPGL